MAAGACSGGFFCCMLRAGRVLGLVHAMIVVHAMIAVHAMIVVHAMILRCMPRLWEGAA